MNKNTSRIFIEEPTECPCCSYTLSKVNDQLFCKNTACSAQLNKKLEHFAKVLGIKGLGPKTAEKLSIGELTEIFYLDYEETKKVLGEKLAIKLIDEIEKSKTADLSTVLEAFSIPLIGGTASKKICTVVSSIKEITPETCKQAGLGEKATQNLINWVETEYNDLKEFLPFSFKQGVKQDSANLKRVCITGKLKSFKKKTDAEQLLIAAGYSLVDSVTKTTDILIDENDSSSSKREKAMQYGIRIVTDLNDLLKETLKND